MNMRHNPPACAAEFHRRRADDEMEQALASGPLSVAPRCVRRNRCPMAMRSTGHGKPTRKD